MKLTTALALVAFAAPPDLRDAVLGDLAEEHHAIRTRRGPAAAARWLRGQVIGSVPRLLLLSIMCASGASWLRATGVVATFYLAVAGLVVAIHARLFLELALVLAGAVLLVAGAAVAFALAARWRRDRRAAARRRERRPPRKRHEDAA